MLTLLVMQLLSGGFTGPSGVNLIDEVASQGRVQTLTFAGAGVTCVGALGVGTCTIAGGSGGGNFGTLTVAFGSGAQSEYDAPIVTVSAAWVASGSAIVLTPKCNVTVGGNTIDNCRISDLNCTIVGIVAATSFDVACHAPFGASGSYTIAYTGG